MPSQPWCTSAVGILPCRATGHWAVSSSLQYCPTRTSLVRLCVVYPPLCLAEWSWPGSPDGRCGHTKPVSIAWPWQGVVPACQHSWWLVGWRTHSSCALCMRCAGVFCSMCARIPIFFSPDRLWGSNFRIHITGWRPLGTWTLLESWWSCSSRWRWVLSWPTWPGLALSSPPLLSCHPLLRWNQVSWILSEENNESNSKDLLARKNVSENILYLKFHKIVVSLIFPLCTWYKHHCISISDYDHGKKWNVCGLYAKITDISKPSENVIKLLTLHIYSLLNVT